MSDLIDRDEALKVIRELSAVNLNKTDYVDGFADGYNAGVKDAEPKKGRWDVEHGVVMHDDIYGDIYRCSLCGYRERNPEGFNYCPNCGAKMEKEENEK